jgi:hypothetical protein
MRAATTVLNTTWREEDVADEIEADEAARANTTRSSEASVTGS